MIIYSLKFYYKIKKIALIIKNNNKIIYSNINFNLNNLIYFYYKFSRFTII